MLSIEVFSEHNGSVHRLFLRVFGRKSRLNPLVEMLILYGARLDLNIYLKNQADTQPSETFNYISV